MNIITNTSIKTLAFAFIISILSISSSFAGDGVSPMTIDGAKTVTTDEAKKLFDNGVLFIDVRKDKDWNAGRISDAVQLNIKKNFTEQSLLENMKKDEPAVIYCNGEKCMRSSNAAKMAVGWGFTNIYYYRDGFPAWKKAGYPVE